MFIHIFFLPSAAVYHSRKEPYFFKYNTFVILIKNFMKDLEIFRWLVGKWEGLQGSGIYHEEWEFNDESVLTGKAYLIKKGEILNTEKLKIHLSGSDVLYTADVSHNPSPVSFRLTSYENNIFIFENPDHDFPQKITYEMKNDGSLFAVVEAINNGKNRRIEYSLKLML